MLSAASQLVFAHGMALSSNLPASNFPCEHENLLAGKFELTVRHELTQEKKRATMFAVNND